MNLKSIFPALLLTLSLTLAGGCNRPSQADSGPQDGGAAAGGVVELWRIIEGLTRPEIAYYDAETDSIFVSNVNGNPKMKDGNGYISKITTDGKMVEAKWATGLDAPKGLRAHGERCG